jgi:hypothetical protein
VTSAPSTLPRAKLAQVPAAKLRDYVLNATHPQGGPKARVFAAALGITGLDWQYLREQLLTGVQAAPARHVRSTTWGEFYEVVIDVTGRNGQVHAVRTGWIIRTDDPRPQLVTAYVDLP